MLDAVPKGIVEEELIGHGTAAAIREMRLRGKSKKAIARELDLDIKTVRKWSSEEWKPQRRRARVEELTVYEEVIAKRFPEVGYNAEVLYRELQDAGYEGSPRSVRRYVEGQREAARPELATMRFETGPGAQAQVDWGMIGVWIGEQRVKVHLFVMVLGFSRRIFVRAYEHERLGNLLDGHQAAFSHFGGRTATLLYDNPRTIVLSKDEANGTVEWNRRFKERMDFYGVEVKLCRYYRAQTKGKVESGVKYVKRNALAGRRFASYEELNAWLETWCLSVADTRVHGTTHARPIDRFAAEALTPLGQRPAYRYARVQTRIVPPDALVAIAASRYSVPVRYVGRTVSIQETATDYEIFDGADCIARHAKAGRYAVMMDRAHYAGLLRPGAPGTPPAPPQWDPTYRHLGNVLVRDLATYVAVAEAGGAA